MDPFTIAMLGTTALQGISTLLGGFASAKAAAAQAQQARMNAQIAGTQSTEIGEQSREQLRQTLGVLDSVQNARGVDLASPTAMAVDAKSQLDSDRNEGIQRLGALQQQGSDLTQAFGYQNQSDFAIPLSIGSAAAQFGGGLSRAFPNAGVTAH